METTTENQLESNIPWSSPQPPTSSHNKTLFKGIITAVLILAMLIPTAFVSNLVSEREERQKEVTREVCAKWATQQTLTGPYIYLPYTVKELDKDGKLAVENKQLLFLPDALTMTGAIEPEIRPRSIYKVLLYKSDLNDNGNFILHLPKEIDASSVQWDDAKICFGLSDFKGIEEKISIHLNGSEYELSPGLPANTIDSMGLSAHINLSATDIDKPLSFTLPLKIKGSGMLDFVPLAGNSHYELKSSWSNPSFDGNNLPVARNITDAGFEAKWNFNKANLPFGTVLKELTFNKNNIAFGVTMAQPADQYAKTMRCVKYAILIIGLTFAFFFVIELMQDKPFHPVQYILIGLALVIFYTLLLSISEFVLFDISYLIAAFATVILIASYAKSHFKSTRTAFVFGSVLTCLYGFIFILIRLEDTALLVGSIGLFIILALVMYASRKIDWYGKQ
jgi:inner membrane protein